MRRIAERLLALDVTPLWIEWQGYRKGADAADVRGGTDELMRIVGEARPRSADEPVDAESEPPADKTLNQSRSRCGSSKPPKIS